MAGQGASSLDLGRIVSRERGRNGFFVPTILLGMLLAVLVNDFVVDRRLHKASWIGCGLVLLSGFAGQAIATSGFGMGVVRAMSQAGP